MRIRRMQAFIMAHGSGANIVKPQEKSHKKERDPGDFFPIEVQYSSSRTIEKARLGGSLIGSGHGRDEMEGIW